MLGNSGTIVPIEYTTITGNLPSSSGLSNYYQYPSDWVNFDNIVLVSFEWYRADSGDWRICEGMNGSSFARIFTDRSQVGLRVYTNNSTYYGTPFRATLAYLAPLEREADERPPVFLTGIELTTQPTNRTYTVDSNGVATFDFSGSVVTASYSDGHTEQILSPSWSPLSDSIIDTTTSKTTTVTATYEGYSVTTSMTVNNPLSSIAITTQPTTRTYTVNSSGNATFSFTGAVVRATYTNGATTNISPTWSPTTGSITTATSSASTTVTASYGGKTATTTMTLNNPLKSIAITTQPTTRTYEQGATFSSSGSVVTATYTNTKTKTVSASWSPSTLSTAGASITITASFSDNGTTKTATTTVKVNRKFYTGSTVSHRNVNSGGYGSFYTNCSGITNINSTVVYITVDLTNINSLVVTGSFAASGWNTYSGAWLESGSQNREYPYYTIGQGADATYYAQMQRVTSGGTATSFTFNTSSLSGSYRLCLGCYVNSTETASASASATKVIGVY